MKRGDGWRVTWTEAFSHAGRCPKINDHRSVAGLVHQVTDQLDGPEFRIGHVKT